MRWTPWLGLLGACGATDTDPGPDPIQADEHQVCRSDAELAHFLCLLTCEQGVDLTCTASTDGGVTTTHVTGSIARCGSARPDPGCTNTVVPCGATPGAADLVATPGGDVAFADLPECLSLNPE